MRAFLTWIELTAVWGLFFGTSVYGHVALKLAMDEAAAEGIAFWRAALGVRGSSAAVAWALSCMFWALVVSRQELMTANAVSSLRFVLTGLAAWLWLREEIGGRQAVGMLLIGAGILLVR
jgi:drug/metabolite transporter (DMT)-like permease